MELIKLLQPIKPQDQVTNQAQFQEVQEFMATPHYQDQELKDTELTMTAELMFLKLDQLIKELQPLEQDINQEQLTKLEIQEISVVVDYINQELDLHLKQVLDPEQFINQELALLELLELLELELLEFQDQLINQDLVDINQE